MNGGSHIDIDANMFANNFTGNSDERLKSFMKDIDGSLKIKATFKRYEMKTEPGQMRYGVGASQLEKEHPELIRINSRGFKAVAYIDLLIAKVAQLEFEAIEDRKNSANVIKVLAEKLELLEARLKKAGI
jgi:hypothetical protein